MKKLYALLLVLVMFGSKAFALHPADYYPKLECVHGNMTYTPPAGDDLSEIAQRYRTAGTTIQQEMEVIKSVQTNGITNLNSIQANKPMIIPCSAGAQATHSTTAPSAVAPTTTAKNTKTLPNFEHGTLAQKIFLSAATKPEADEPSFTVPMQSMFAPQPLVLASLNVTPPILVQPTHDSIVAAVVSQPKRMPTPSSPPPSKPSASKVKKVTYWQMRVPHAVAFDADGISIFALDTDVHTLLVRTRDNATLETVSRAHVTGKNKDVLLSIALKGKLPDEPFTIVIDGVKAPISGEVFADNAKPFKGKFPGQPRKDIHTLLTVGRVSVSAVLMSLTLGGPEVGVPVAIASWAIPAMINHHYESSDRKDAVALAAINARLAAATEAANKSTQGELH